MTFILDVAAGVLLAAAIAGLPLLMLLMGAEVSRSGDLASGRTCIL